MSNADVRERHAQQLEKTQMCKFFSTGRCGRGPNCSFAHHSSEIRRRPDLNKTSMCKEFLANGNCSNPRCTFAHDERELRATAGFFKTKLCKFADSGRCKHGKRCRFAHTSEELLAASVKEESVQAQVPATLGIPSMQMPVTPECSPLSAISGTSEPIFHEAPLPASQVLHALTALSGQLTALANVQAQGRTSPELKMTGSGSQQSGSTRGTYPDTYPTSVSMTGEVSSQERDLTSGSDTSFQGDEETAKWDDNKRNVTTLMILNVPRFLTQGALLSLLEDLSPIVRNALDFFYLPWNSLEEMNLGHAIINFFDRSTAALFTQEWSNLPFPGHPDKKRFRILPAALQGRAANLRHFSGFSLAHHDERRFRPLVRALPSDPLVPMALAKEMASPETRDPVTVPVWPNLPPGIANYPSPISF